MAVVRMCHAPLLREDLVDLSELREPHRSLVACHPEVETEGLVPEPGLCKCEVSKRSRTLSQLHIVRHEHPTLAGGDDLVRVKAEARHLAKATGHAPTTGRPMRLRAVFD